MLLLVGGARVGEVCFLGLVRRDADFHLLLAVFFVFCYQGVLSWRETLDFKAAIFPGHGEKRVVQDVADCLHPWVNIALDGEIHLCPLELLLEFETDFGLRFVEFLVLVRGGVDVVGGVVAVSDQDFLPLHHSDDARNVHAANLIEKDGRGWRIVLASRGILHIEKHVAKRAILVGDDPVLARCLTAIELDALGVHGLVALAFVSFSFPVDLALDGGALCQRVGTDGGDCENSQANHRCQFGSIHLKYSFKRYIRSDSPFDVCHTWISDRLACIPTLIFVVFFFLVLFLVAVIFFVVALFFLIIAFVVADGGSTREATGLKGGVVERPSIVNEVHQ